MESLTKQASTKSSREKSNGTSERQHDEAWSLGGKASHSFLSIETCNRAGVRRLQLPKRLPVILKLLNFVMNFFKTLNFAAGIFEVFKDV